MPLFLMLNITDVPKIPTSCNLVVFYNSYFYTYKAISIPKFTDSLSDVFTGCFSMTMKVWMPSKYTLKIFLKYLKIV